MLISCTCTISLILLFAIVSYTESLDYDDLIATGKYCQSRDQCEGYRRRLDYTERNCECDKECTTYSDCCIDARIQRRNSGTRRTKSNMKCFPYGTKYHAGVYMIDNCPQNWNGLEEVREKCVGTPDFSDPLKAAPVTSEQQNKTYRNIYCAECNGADIDSLKFHHIHLGCEGLEDPDVTNEQILADLTYDNGAWGVYRYISGQNTFVECSILFDVPSNLNSSVRFCRPKLVSTCAPDWTSPRTRRTCQEYMAVVYDRQNVAYRNPHCAICNHKAAEQLFCSPSNLGQNKPFSFTLFLDINTSNGNQVGKQVATPSCPSNQIYDPFYKRCNRMVCLLPGYVVVNQRCVKQ